MTADLVAFLRAQLDAEERIARAATPGPWEQDPERAGSLTSAEYWYVVDCSGTPAAGENAEHVARHDPARVLAEITAKRALASAAAGAKHDYQYWNNNPPADPEERVRVLAQMDARWSAWHFVLTTLAEPYVERSGHRSEWAPDA